MVIGKGMIHFLPITFYIDWLFELKIVDILLFGHGMEIKSNKEVLYEYSCAIP